MSDFRALLFLAACLGAMLTRAADPLDTWHLRDAGTSTNLNAVAYAAEGFVAVGDGGYIGHSEDGTNWQSYYAAPYANLRSVAHSNGLYCVVGNGGNIYTSPDGQVWTPRTSYTTNNLLCIRWLNNRFLVGGENGTLLSSLNGADWAVLDSGTTYSISALTYGNGLYLAAINAFPPAWRMRLSADTLVWTNDTENFADCFDMLFHDNTFLVLTRFNIIYRSTNGMNWSSYHRGGDAPDYLTALTRDHGRYVAVGGTFSFLNPRIGSSAGGYTWKHHPIIIEPWRALRGVASGSSSMVAVGEGGLILQSDPTFRLLSYPEFISGEPHWTLHGNSGRNYRLQAASDAAAGPWEDVFQTVATNDVIILRDPTTPLPSFRFYRVATP